MAEKVTLKKADGTTIYPQTLVDTAEIYDGAVTVSKVDFAGFKQSTPTTTILHDYGTITSNTELTMPYTGFLTGKAVTLGSDKHACMCLTADDNGIHLGGIPFTKYGDNNQVSFCFPVIQGQKIYARCSGSGAGQLERVRLVGYQFGNNA